MYIAVIAAGFACGFINVLAGSGSLITLPLLIFLGLPANVANGTNRVAILMQNIVGVSSYRRNNLLNVKHGIKLAIPALLGGIIGAQIAVDLSEEIMHKVIGALMVVMLFVLIIRPKRWIKQRIDIDASKTTFMQMIVFFGIGIYGGFIQAGVGIFLLMGLLLSAGYDELHANPVKLLIVLFFTVPALIIFVLNDQVVWLIGLILGIGNMLGAYVAVKVSIKKGNPFIRWVLILVVAGSAIKMLGLHTHIINLF